MSREVNLERLASLENPITSSYFIHYYYFHRDLLNALRTYSIGSLLDIGCGNKPYEGYCKNQLDSYLGCDIAQSSLNKVDIICHGTNIPLNDESFDTVLSTQTIEHVDDHNGLVCEAYRLLKKGGYFILSGPFNWPLHEEPYDYFRFTKHGFNHILQKAGFEVIEIHSNGGVWATAGQGLVNAFATTSFNSFWHRMLFRFYSKRKIIGLMNKIFVLLDARFYSDSNTINYVVVARKQ